MSTGFFFWICVGVFLGITWFSFSLGLPIERKGSWQLRFFLWWSPVALAATVLGATFLVVVYGAFLSDTEIGSGLDLERIMHFQMAFLLVVPIVLQFVVPFLKNTRRSP